jgi:hypothetical protein
VWASGISEKNDGAQRSNRTSELFLVDGLVDESFSGEGEGKLRCYVRLITFGSANYARLRGTTTVSGIGGSDPGDSDSSPGGVGVDPGDGGFRDR